MIEVPNVLYTAEATVAGGREGHGRTSDGRLEVELDVPTEMGGHGGPGTNPEQPFAVGYAACFQSSLLRFAAGRGLDLSSSRIISRVGVGLLQTGGFGLTVALHLDAPRARQSRSPVPMRRAHEACHYSRATRGEHRGHAHRGLDARPQRGLTLRMRTRRTVPAGAARRDGRHPRSQLRASPQPGWRLAAMTGGRPVAMVTGHISPRRNPWRRPCS